MIAELKVTIDASRARALFNVFSAILEEYVKMSTLLGFRDEVKEQIWVHEINRALQIGSDVK